MYVIFVDLILVASSSFWMTSLLTGLEVVGGRMLSFGVGFELESSLIVVVVDLVLVLVLSFFLLSSCWMIFFQYSRSCLIMLLVGWSEE